MQHRQRNVRRLRWLAVLIVPCLGLLALGSAWMLGRRDTIEVDPSDLTYRFIRIKYDGHGWDDGMDAISRADINFLDYFHKLTGFKTASQSDALAISSLAKYPKGYAPPMVYMTGDGKINVPDRDVQIMRDYLMGGAMLFADCGSRAWHGAFLSFIKRLFPEENLIRIPQDDTIFQAPFPLENGAPPLWHHGGRDALGIKVKGRWVVFYHPGHLTDAWKTNRGNLTRKDTEGTFEMGVNLIYYAYSNYLELTRKYRRGEGGVTAGHRTPLRSPLDENSLTARHRAPPRSPWARYTLESVGVYGQPPPGDKPLQLIRKLVEQDSDLRTVMSILEGVPFKTFNVSSPQAKDGDTKAIIVNIPDGRILVLIFENGNDVKKTYWQRDSLLLAPGSSHISMLFDVIPKSRPPQPDDFSRVLFWYESTFTPIDSAIVETIRTGSPPAGAPASVTSPAPVRSPAESTRLAPFDAPSTPVVRRDVDLPRPEEIPRSIDDVPNTDDWGKSLSRQAESQLNSV